MEYKIKTINHDGTIIEVEVSFSVYNFDKENNWQEDWRSRKSKREDSYEEVLKIYEKNGLPLELQEVSSETRYIKGCEYEQLHKVIDKLPKVQRRRIMLRYFHGLSLSDIAKIEGISKVSVKSSIDQALRKLKNMSNEKYE